MKTEYPKMLYKPVPKGTLKATVLRDYGTYNTVVVNTDEEFNSSLASGYSETPTSELPEDTQPAKKRGRPSKKSQEG